MKIVTGLDPPTVVDRMVQQAVAQILTPIFERVFSDNSFGFRPHRGAHDAIAKVVDLYNQGYRRVVDLVNCLIIVRQSLTIVRYFFMVKYHPELKAQVVHEYRK